MKKSNSKLLISVISILSIFVSIVLFNAIVSRFNIQLDLTENKQYTLTENTKKILTELKLPINCKFYFSKSVAAMPVSKKTYGRRVVDLLKELEENSNGKFKLEIIDPQPDSDEADAATMDGVTAQMSSRGDRYYMGISLNCIDKTLALPALSAQRETLLEYDIMSAISRLTRTHKPTIGLITSLRVTKQLPTREMIQKGNYHITPAWAAISELRKDYNIKTILNSTKKIPDDIDLLLLIHPTGISEELEFAIDQYIMNGGKVAAFLDSFSLVSARVKGLKVSSTLPKLLPKWGIEFSNDKCVADVNYSRRMNSPKGEVNHVGILDFNDEAMNKRDVLTSSLQLVTMVFTGGFLGEPADGLKKDVLIQSSPKSCVIDGKIITNPQQAFSIFKADKQRYDLAIRLTGNFQTAFSKGLETKKSEKDSKDKSEKTEVLQDSKGKGVVILVADSDLLFDPVCVKEQNILGTKFRVPINGNLNFFLSIIESLSGNDALIGIRSRQTAKRPFTRVKEMQAKAELKFKSEIQKLEKELEKAQSKIIQLQQRNKVSKSYLVSPEVQQELKNFSKKKIEISKQLKVVRRSLRADINRLENILKFINILLIPILISIIGLIIAIIRKRRSAAK